VYKLIRCNNYTVVSYWLLKLTDVDPTLNTFVTCVSPTNSRDALAIKQKRLLLKKRLGW